MDEKRCPTCKRAFKEGERVGITKEGRHIRRRNKKFTEVMGEYDRGALRSGSKRGPKVNSRKQAEAIAYSELKNEKKRSQKKKKK